jgi:hypothetical protein
MSLWGAPIALFAAWPTMGWGLANMAVVGAGNSMIDVAGFTLLQRIVSDAVLGRALAVVEILAAAMIGLGSLLAPALISEFGIRWALMSALGLPLLALLFRWRLQAIDDSAVVPQHELDLLSSVPIFKPLSPTTLEKLAARLRPVSAGAGQEIVRQGEPGELFFVIESGSVEVIHDGELAATLGPGDYFGEIALLQEVPRVATCIARTPTRLYELDREVFISAVSGHALTHAAVTDVVEGRLEELEAL